MKNDFRRAKEHYLEAIGVEADCIEALYNLGYVNKKLNMFMEALQALEKIQTFISLPEVLFQIANINEIIGRTKQALKWYQIILTKIPNDPGILARIGSIFFRVIFYIISIGGWLATGFALLLGKLSLITYQYWHQYMVGNLLCQTIHVWEGFILSVEGQSNPAQGSQVEIDGGQLPTTNHELPKGT